MHCFTQTQESIPYRPELRKTVKNQREHSLNPDKAEQILGFRGWNERGYIPHRDEPGLTQFITFRLGDSFPAELQHEWEKIFQLEDDRECRLQLEAWIDLGRGACHLQNKRVAEMVFQTLRHFDGQRYRLLAFTLMPNHVHVLFEVTTVPMHQVVKSWKQYSSNRANQLLGRTGTFWQADYWDTYMRDAEHEALTIRYIRNNPVKAGLVTDWKQWPWTYLADEQ
ncbi:MAG: transposase [Verrucomicrobiota bacterium]